MSITREQLIQHWEVIEAFKNGAEIEYKRYLDGEWELVKDPSFILNTEYRVKP